MKKSTNLDGMDAVNIVLSYIRLYKNDKDVLKLISELYGIQEPNNKKSGYTLYKYLYECIQGYSRLFERKNIDTKNTDVSNFTIDEYSRISKFKILHWCNKKQFYTLAEMLTNPNEYDKLVLSCIGYDYIGNFDDILKNFVDKNIIGLTLQEGVGKLYNCANWAIEFNKYENFEKIMGKIYAFEDVNYPMNHLRNSILISTAFNSENVIFLKYLNNRFDWKNTKSKNDDRTLYSKTCKRYITSFNDDPVFLDFIVDTFPYFIQNCSLLMINDFFNSEKYHQGLDNETIEKYLRKFEKFAKFNDIDLIDSCKERLSNIINNIKNHEKVMENNYHDIKFYINCYGILEKVELEL